MRGSNEICSQGNMTVRAKALHIGRSQHCIGRRIVTAFIREISIHHDVIWCVRRFVRGSAI
jgi:hypothetical protein